MKIEGTLELISNSKELLSRGDIIAIAVAIIAVIGTVITTLLTNRTTKKISKSNEELQDKWNQKNIDASLTASARIEWIQSVRKATAELISLYSTLMITSDKNELIRLNGESRKTSELLILYFGPEYKDGGNNTLKFRNLLLKKENNDYKNDAIVQFLRQQQIDFAGHFMYQIEQKEEKIKEEIEFWSTQRYANATKGPDIIQYDEDGNDYTINEPIINPEDEEKYQKALSVGVKEHERLENLEKDLSFLCDFMRIYLKIEWNKAKNIE